AATCGVGFVLFANDPGGRLVQRGLERPPVRGSKARAYEWQRHKPPHYSCWVVYRMSRLKATAIVAKPCGMAGAMTYLWVALPGAAGPPPPAALVALVGRVAAFAADPHLWLHTVGDGESYGLSAHVPAGDAELLVRQVADLLEEFGLTPA